MFVEDRRRRTCQCRCIGGRENTALVGLLTSLPLKSGVIQFLARRIPQLQRDQEKPLFMCGLLMLVCSDSRVGDAEVDLLAEWLLHDEKIERNHCGPGKPAVPDGFVFDLTFFDQLHKAWNALVLQLRVRLSAGSPAALRHLNVVCGKLERSPPKRWPD